MSIWRFADLLPKVKPEHRITLGEGNTPLVRSRRIGPKAGMTQLYFKLEASNPTGSYKDRFAASAVSHMHQAGQSRVLGTSSGNTGSAVAAYAAAAGLTCEMAIVEPAPEGKLQQMLAYGALLYRVKGMGLDANVSRECGQYLKARAEAADSALQISAFCYSPLGMAGVQTISYELAEQQKDLPRPIEHVLVPAGGGGLTLAVSNGFIQMAQKDIINRLPAVHCVQPEGNDTIASALRDGLTEATQGVVCTSNVSGLQVPMVLDGDEVIANCRSTGGTGHVISDETVFELHERLAREEGIYSEPAGAVALAGLLQAIDSGVIDREAVVVCLVTGSGFKDTASVARMNASRTCPTLRMEQLIEAGNDVARFFV